MQGSASPQPHRGRELSTVTEALKQGRGLYDLDNLISVPASPGPGWVLLNAPFTFAGQSIFYTLLTPVYVLFGWLMLRAMGQSARFANLWMLLLFSGLKVWELGVARGGSGGRRVRNIADRVPVSRAASGAGHLEA